MNAMAWIRLAAIAVGVIALSALVFFGGPLIAIGDVRPFDEFWVRLAIVVLIVAVAALLVYLDIRRRRQASAEIEKAVTAASEPEGDASVLQEKMRDALATLRRAKGKGGDVLYELPWYIIIGPPGAGKTTALVNSGPEIPARRGGDAGGDRRRRRHALLRLVVHRRGRADRHRRPLHDAGFRRRRPTARAGSPSSTCSRRTARGSRSTASSWRSASRTC